MMRRISSLFILFLLVVVLLGTACNGKDDNEYIQNITFSTELNNMIPEGVTDEFNADVSIIYCTFDLTEKVEETSEITILWIYIYQENGNRTEYLVENWTEKAAGNDRMSMFIYQPVKGWPLGDWRADLYIDGQAITSAPFKVKMGF